jgi:hypothetical protein
MLFLKVTSSRCAIWSISFCNPNKHNTWTLYVHLFAFLQHALSVIFCVHKAETQLHNQKCMLWKSFFCNIFFRLQTFLTIYFLSSERKKCYFWVSFSFMFCREINLFILRIIICLVWIKPRVLLFKLPHMSWPLARKPLMSLNDTNTAVQ